MIRMNNKNGWLHIPENSLADRVCLLSSLTSTFSFFKCLISNLITRCWSPCSLSTRLLWVEKNDYIIMSSVISKRLTISCGDIRLFESVFLRVFQVIQQQIILVSYRGHLSRPNDVAVDAIVPIRLAGKRRRIVLGSRNLKSSFLLTARTDGGRPKRFHYTTITCCRWLKGKSANGGHCQRMQSVVRDDYTLTMGDRLVAQGPLLTINRNGQWARHKYRIDLIDSRRSKKKTTSQMISWNEGGKNKKFCIYYFVMTSLRATSPLGVAAIASGRHWKGMGANDG